MHLCSEWGVVPPPTVHRCRWLAGAPKAQHSALPNQGQIQLQVWLLRGQFPPLVFGRTARAGPGRQRDSRAGCRAGVQGNVLAGATAVPGRVVFSPPATTRLSDYPWGHLGKHRLKVLRMGSRRGWILGLNTPFSQLPIMLPVVGPSWGPFHLSIEATTCPPFEGQSARLSPATRLSAPAWPGLTINAPKTPSSPPAPFP